MLDTVEHINCPHAYFFSISRNLLTRMLKRRLVVPLESIVEIESYCDDGPSPEQIVAGRIELACVIKIIANLPSRCQEVVKLRKVEGWSQRMIADHLGITEKAVEKQVWLGVKAIREAWSRKELAEAEQLENGSGRKESRQ